MKRAPLTTNEMLTMLAKIERREPGRLASWLRAHPPVMPGPAPERAHFVHTVELRK